ncbi:MAG: sigma-70 family RNA polymerase sigma factor [Phycisphaerales bacterium]|nr:sigma-70 family RNA polymerase sigma factor [Phycisphaerales bacterium]
MSLAQDITSRARRYDRVAIEQLLAANYPGVYRLAAALTGSQTSARKIAVRVMRKSVERVEKWKDEKQLAGWFRHHTVLRTRRLVGSTGQPPGDDALVDQASKADLQYVAFIAALRKLSFQPREALVLAEGERLDGRELAVAMDCSIEAAANHLVAARRELMTVVGDQLNVRLAQLARVYQSLTPDEHLAVPLIKRVTRRRLWPRRLAIWSRNIITIALIALLGYFAWHYAATIDW